MSNLIPQEGTKDYEVFTTYQKLTVIFIDELHKKGFLRKKFSIEEEVLAEIITERVNAEAKSIAKLETMFRSKQLDSFLNYVEKYGIMKEDVMNYYMISLVHQLLDMIERFKKYLLATLDKESIGLRENPTLGDIFAILQSKKINHKFDEIMDNKLRNALGHGSYYWKKTEFYYTVDPEYKRTKTLTLGELFVIIRKGVLVSNAFNSVAFERILKIKKEST